MGHEGYSSQSSDLIQRYIKAAQTGFHKGNAHASARRLIQLEEVTHSIESFDH